MGIASKQMAAVRTNVAALESGQMQALFARYLCLPEDFGATARNRLYSHGRTFWLFLAQVLAADGGCAAAVQTFLAWLSSTEGTQASPNTGAYCKARQGLPLESVKALHAPLAQALDAPSDAFWGRRVLVVDGSSLSMPDTPANQGAWPQPQAQKDGCGFPVMRLLGLFALGTGVWRGVAFGALGVAERTLFHTLWDHFAPGDIALADTGFCSFADYVLLEGRGVDCVMLNHHRRKTGLRELKQLGKGDRLVEWFKNKACPTWLTPEQWDALPETTVVREMTVPVDVPGFRSKTLVIATTLRDPKAYPLHDIAALYRRRWAIELYFRDIKIAMGADVLRCKTPAMVEKELWMHVLAYNLVRGLMLDAARHHGTPLERISFKGACDAARSWAPVIAHAPQSRQEALLDAMRRVIDRNRVPNRPDRTEPRARKRRPKNYQLLTQPRHLFKETPHRGKRRGKNP